MISSKLYNKYFGQLIFTEFGITHSLFSSLKHDQATNVEQFCLIALCNVAFKLIIKILATWLRPLLGNIVALEQSALILGRHITDNTIINHEIMHHFRNKKGKMGLMAIKVYMAKVYGRVEWGVLQNILKMHGFDERTIKLIMECVTTSSFSILLNGSPGGYFQASRGFRQGVTLSLLSSSLSFLIFYLVFCMMLN